MEASVKAGVDVPAIPDNSDTVCQEAISELLKTIPTETDITVSNSKHSLPTDLEEASDVRDGDSESVVSEKHIVDTPAMSSRESGRNKVFRPQPSPQPSTSSREYQDQKEDYDGSEQVPGTSMSNILYDIGLNVVSDFMKNNPAKYSPKKAADKSSKSKGKDERQHEMKKYYCQECPAYYYELGCMHRHLKNAHKLFIPTEELRNYYRRTTVRRKGSKLKDMESGPVGVTETKKSRGRVEGEEKVATDSSKLSTMMNYRCTLCLYKTYNYAKLLLHVQVLHGKAQREQDIICQVSSPTSSFSEPQNPSNLKPVLLLKTENRLDANPSGTDKPVYAKVIPVKKIVLVKKKSRTEDTKAGEVQQFGVKKLEDCIALACPFCEERPECKTNLNNHLKFVHNMDIMEECNKLAQPYPVTNATNNPDQQVQKLGEEEPVVENVSEDKKTCTSTGQTQENRLCSGALESAVKKEEIKELTVANYPHEGKVSDDEGQEKTEDDHVENGCTKTENTSDSNTKYKTAYSLSQLMPLVCKLCLQVHVRCVSFMRHMRCAHNIQVHCQEKFDIPLSGQYFNGRDCRFCGFVARDKMTFFVHLGHFHKIVHYAALAAKYEKQSEMPAKSTCKIVPKSEPLRCSDCGFTTMNASNYQKHRSESHISRQRSSHFKSDQLKNANKKDATDANEDTTKCAAPSTNMRKSVCEECGQTFTYAYERDYHVFKVHKNKQKEEPAWGRRRKPGEPLTTGKSIRKKLCEECGQIFTYAYERDYHVFKVHKNKQKEEPAWGKRRTPREPLVLEVSLPVKKETDKDVKVSKKCTKRKKKEAKGDKEGAKRAAKSKRRKVEETRLDDGGAKFKVESSQVVRKVAAKKTSKTPKKSSSGCYKHKKKFMPANETTLKEWEHLLKASYACNQYPSREEIQRLAMETGQEFALIRTWFAYERQNQKLGPRPRNVYYKQSTDHTAYMEEELQKNPKPTMQDMSRIAEKTGLSLGLVIYWFKKRVSLTFLDSEEHSPETKSSVAPVSESVSVSATDPSYSKDQEQEELVQLKAPKLDVKDVRHRKSRQSRRKGIPKKRAAEEDQTGDSSTETKEEAVDNKPAQAGDYVKHMTDIDASSMEETGNGRVQKKLQRRRIDELVSKVAARVMLDKGSTSVESVLGTGDWTDQLGSEENGEQPKELDQLETQQCAHESPNMSVHQTERVGQQIGKNPEKIEVKTEVTPMNLKVQRKSVTKIVKQQQQTLTESAEKQSRLPDQRSSYVLDLNVKAKEADTQSEDQWNDEKPVVKKAKISHQKARALANMIPYYCCLVCDPTPVKSPDKLEATAFTQYTALTQHLRDKHNIRSRFEKLFTIKKFPNVKTNTQEKYQCQYCPIYYHMPGFLVKHLRDQHGVKDQIVKGSAHFEVVKPEVMENMGSGREVKTEDGASDVHPSSSHGRTVTQYCCALCPESNDKTRNAFLQFKSLEDHLMTCHKVTSGFDTYCTSQQVPVLEVSKHDVVTYGKHRCKLCSAQYNYMGFMARHLSEKHELKDLDMKWSDYVEVVTPEMESCSQDSVLKDQSCKLLGKDTTKTESERQLVQEQHSRSSVAKPTSNPSKKPSFSVNLSPSSSALDLSLRKKSLSQEQLTSAQSGHIIYQCTLCKSFFRFYTNATDHLGTKHSKYGAACAKHIKEMSAKIVEFRRHREQENSSSANQEVNEGSPSLTKKTTVSDQDIAQMSSLPPESLVGLSNEGDNTDFSTLDISLIDAEGVIYECLTCKAVFPKWALLIRHYECCTWDSSSHLHAMVRMPREVVESFFATSPSGSECSFCYSTIKDQTMLASHLQTHTQPRVLLTCEGDEDRKDSDCPIATSAAKIAQYTGTPLSQPETTVSQEETSANKDLNEN